LDCSRVDVDGAAGDEATVIDVFEGVAGEDAFARACGAGDSDEARLAGVGEELVDQGLSETVVAKEFFDGGWFVPE